MSTIKLPVLYEIMAFAGARFKVHQTFSRCHRVGHVTLITTRSFVFVIRIFGELNLLQTCVLKIPHMRSISVMCSIICAQCVTCLHQPQFSGIRCQSVLILNFIVDHPHPFVMLATKPL